MKARNEKTSTKLENVTITINQKLHGIEVKGVVTTQQDAWLRDIGFDFSRRKDHYYRAFDEKVYKAVLEHFATSKKNRGASKSKVTIAEAAPINMAEAFKDEPDEADDLFDLTALFGEADDTEEPEPVKKEQPKTKVKAQPVKAQPVKAQPAKKSDAPCSLEDWKAQVIMCVETILDDAIAAITAGA